MNARAYRWIIFGLFSLAYFGVFAQRMGMAVISPDLSQSLQLTPLQMGTLGSMTFYSYAVFILFSGFISTKFGPRNTMGIFFGLGGLGTLFFVSVDSFFLLMLGALLIGLGTSVVVTAGTTSFSRWFSMKEYGNVCAWFFVFGGIGNIVGTAPLSWMVQEMGWRMAYGSIAILMIALAVLAFFIVRRPPADYVVEDSLPSPASDGPKVRLLSLLGQAMKNINFWCIAIWYMTIAAVHYAFNGMWAGLYITNVFGLSKLEIGGILTLGAVGFAIGNPVLMWLSTHVFKSFRVGITLVNVLALVGAGMIAFCTESLPHWSLYLVTLFIGLSVAASSIVYTATRSIFGAAMAGPLAGVWSFVLFGGGGCMQLVIGYFVNSGKAANLPLASSYHTAFLILFCCSLIGTIAGFVLKDVYRDTTAN
ncbi:MFS transporter [uncultured Desulfovibrio sp.]|uniref:MFS transporter n=1 Tax=uncultured Desulfovibrio sp. TaxID=167968 RepID=UPI002805423F|nr:MFS transporter [uncultured Desulfovibrio sp.]